MLILPSTYIDYYESPRQTLPSLPMSMVWSVLVHVAALVALLYWGLPNAHWQAVANKEPLTLVEVSLNKPAPVAMLQTTQITQAAPKFAQTRTQSSVVLPSESAKPLVTPNPPSVAPTSIATAANATSPVNVPVTLQAGSSEKTNSLPPLTSATSSSTNISLAQAAPASVTPTKSNVAATSAAPAPVAPSTELPSSSAAYLNNPPPQRSSQSRRLGELGTVKWQVLINVDGTASQPELVQSSGYPRLDDTAKAAVLAWRYIPGKRGGVPEAMRYVVPLSFE